MNALNGGISGPCTALPEFGDEEAEGFFLDPHEDTLNATSSNMGLIQFKAVIGFPGKTVDKQVLVDSGASGDYVDKSVLDDIHVQQRTYERKIIRLPRGIRIVSSGTAKFAVSLGTFKFVTTAVVIDDLGYDLILGRRWLAKFNPNINWRTGDLSITTRHPYRHHYVKAVGSSSLAVDLKCVEQLNLINANQADSDMKRPKAEHCLFIVRQVKDTPDVPDDKAQPVPDVAIKSDDPKVKAMIQRHSKVFRSDLPPGLPPDRGMTHGIDTGDAKPVNIGAYSLSTVHMDELRRQLKILTESGLVRTSSSPWGFPVLFVKKANGEWRMCIDYRALNKVTVRNTYPLPKIRDMIDMIGTARYLTKLDLLSGFWQVRMAEDSIQKTAFNTQWGKYEFLAMPFGLTNAPSTFQTMMNTVLHGLNGEFCVVYLDDVLIFSQTPEEHLRHIDMVLTRLEENQLYVKPSKCVFFADELEFCGFVVGKGLLRPVPMKVDVLKNWPRPTNVHEVRQFLGMAEYYRRCIKDLAKISAPLSDLLKTTDEALRKKKFRAVQWNLACEKAFQELKDRLTTSPVVRQPIRDQPFTIETDASEWAIGAVLLQRQEDGILHPVAYDGRKLSGAELNYPVHEKELLAIKHALHVWRPYIENGTETTVITDHESLKYLKTTKNPSKRLARWVDEFQSYDLNIEYRPGAEAVMPDSISRRPDLMESAPANRLTNGESLRLNAVDLSVGEEVVDSLNALQGCDEDEWYSAMVEFLQSATPPKAPRLEKVVRQMAKDFRLLPRGDDVCLYRYYEEGDVLAPYIEKPFRQDLVNRLHEEYGHFGRPGLMGLLHTRGYWPNQEQDVERTAKYCPQCQVAKGSRRSIEREAAQTLQTTKVRPFERWALDLIGVMPLTPEGNRWIVTAVDYATGWPLAKAIPEATADVIARFIYYEIYVQYGAPRELITDNGSNIVSAAVKHLTDQLHTRHRHTTPYHPRTNGKVENLNGIFGRCLTKMLIGKPTRLWDQYIGQALFAARTRIHSGSKRSPFYLLYGVHPRLPGEEDKTDDKSASSVDGPVFDTALAALEAEQRIRTVRHARAVANELLYARAMRAQRIRDDRVVETGFKAGDWVLVRHEDPQKLEPKWFGPYKVLKAHPVGTYALQEAGGKVMTNLVNGARLVKAYVDPGDDVRTWSSSRWCKALKRQGLKAERPIELRHVLDEVEKDVTTYSEMSLISKKEWDERYGQDSSPKQLRQLPVDEDAVVDNQIAQMRRKQRRHINNSSSPSQTDSQDLITPERQSSTSKDRQVKDDPPAQKSRQSSRLDTAAQPEPPRADPRRRTRASNQVPIRPRPNFEIVIPVRHGRTP